jgi:hypothetical protein
MDVRGQRHIGMIGARHASHGNPAKNGIAHSANPDFAAWPFS